MSNKQHNKFNRTNGYHGQQYGHSNRQEKPEDEARQDGAQKNGFRKPDFPGFHHDRPTFKEHASGLLNAMNREIGHAGNEISQIITDLIVPVIVAAAALPKMELTVNGIRIVHDDTHTAIYFRHPESGEADEDGDDEDDEDDDRACYGCEDCEEECLSSYED